MTKRAGFTGRTEARQGMAAMRGAGPALAAALALSGCAALNPAGWFHRQEGGVIAQQKGPLPGANQPYPNLASVPPVPKAPDLAALHAISAGLIEDRAHAHYLAETAPLPDPSRPATAPGLFGVGSLPPPVAPAVAPSTAPSTGASAVMPAVTAAPAPAAPKPAPPPTPPAKAPVTAVHSAALAAPAVAPTPSASAAPEAAASAPLPAIPAAPPALPAIATATPGHPLPQAAPPPPPQAAGPGALTIRFAPGSASLPAHAAAALRTLAASRGARMMEAIGHGDAASAAPSDQLAATRLGLARAKAIAAALVAAGVPKADIAQRADASGHGGEARLR